jgi:hypothetical protein
MVVQASTLIVQMDPSSPVTARMRVVSPGVRTAASRCTTQLLTTAKETPRP